MESGNADYEMEGTAEVADVSRNILNLVAGNLALVRCFHAEDEDMEKLADYVNDPKHRVTCLIMDNVVTTQSAMLTLFSRLSPVSCFSRLEFHSTPAAADFRVVLEMARFIRTHKALQEFGLSNSGITQQSLQIILEAIGQTDIHRVYLNEPFGREVFGSLRMDENRISKVTLDLCMDYTSTDIRSIQRLLKAGKLSAVNLRAMPWEHPKIFKAPDDFIS